MEAFVKTQIAKHNLKSLQVTNYFKRA